MGERKHKILIVEDGEDLRETLASELQIGGFLVEAAADGESALKLIERGPFDAVVTDMFMPGMSGIELVAAIKTSGTNAMTPVLMITGAADMETVASAAEIKALHILLKPFQPGVLKKTLASLIANQEISAAVDSRVATSIAKSVQDVLVFHLNEAVTFGQISSHRERLSTQGLSTGLVGLNGPRHRGFLSFSLNQAFLRALGSRAFRGIETNSESLDADMTGEVTNQVAGRVKAELAKLGVAISICLPQVVYGLGHKILHRTGATIYRFEFRQAECVGILDFCLVEQTSEREV